MAPKRFVHGSTLLIRGWRLLQSENSLWIWISVPWLIDLALLIFGWAKGIPILQGIIVKIISGWALEGWVYNLVYYPAVIILSLGFLVVWLLLVVAISTIVAAPFNALLAEKALKVQGVPTVNTQSLGQWLGHAFRMLGVTICKAVIFSAAGVTLFFVSFVPGLNLIAAYLSMCLFSMDVFDYSFEARGLTLRQRFAYYTKIRPEIFGLGATLSLTSILPGLTLLALPVAVVGATTLINERLKGANGPDAR